MLRITIIKTHGHHYSFVSIVSCISNLTILAGCVYDDDYYDTLHHQKIRTIVAFVINVRVVLNLD